MAYRVSLITYNEDKPDNGTTSKVYDCTTMEQALDYLYMQQHDQVVTVNIAWVPGQVFHTPT